MGFVCTKSWVFLEKTGTRKPYKKGSIPTGWVLNDILYDYSLIMSTIVLRRLAFDSSEGRFDRCFNILGDIDFMIRLAIKWKMACYQEPMAYYRLHGENLGQIQRVRHAEEFQMLVEKLGKNSDVCMLPEFKKVKNELNYVKGRLCIDQKNRARAMLHLNALPWGKFKIKLLVWFIIPKSFLRLVRL